MLDPADAARPRVQRKNGVVLADVGKQQRARADPVSTEWKTGRSEAWRTSASSVAAEKVPARCSDGAIRMTSASTDETSSLMVICPILELPAGQARYARAWLTKPVRACQDAVDTVDISPAGTGRSPPRPAATSAVDGR